MDRSNLLKVKFPSPFGRSNDAQVLSTALAVAFVAITLFGCGRGSSPSPTPTAAAPVSLAVTPDRASQVIGDTQQFTAIATFSDNSTRNVTTEATWATTANSIAAVAESTGFETAIAAGDATVAARFISGGAEVTGSATVRVGAASLAALTISPLLQRIDLGANQQFTATGTFSDSTTQDLTRFVSWSSSDQNVLRVNTTDGRVGLGNTRGPGAATVSATLNGVSGSTAVSVVRRTPKFLYSATTSEVQGSTIDPVTGELTPITGARVATGVIPSLALTRDRKYLYAADATVGKIWGFEITETGALVALPDSPFTTPTTLLPVSVIAHPTADLLFMTDAEAGEITTFTIAPSGSLTQLMPTTPIGQPLLTTVSPDGRFLYQGTRDVGNATINGFSIATNGSLAAIPGGIATTPVRSRTLTIDPSGRFLYAVIPSSSLGPSSQVFGFTIDGVAGSLTPIIGSPFSAGESPVSAAVEASGRFLYVANAAASDAGESISAFSIDVETGKLESVPGSPFSAPIAPITVAADPGGRFLYVGLDGQQGFAGIRVFTIDERTGALSETPRSPFPTAGAVLSIATTY